jgi:tRNA A37 methylthiotransferase MiaB
MCAFTRSEEKSRPIQAVIEEINALHKQGINEVILTGVHLGGFVVERKSVTYSRRKCPKFAIMDD